MYTYRCPGCAKQLNGEGTFEKPFSSKCLRCGKVFDVTSDMVPKPAASTEGSAPSTPKPAAAAEVPNKEKKVAEERIAPKRQKEASPGSRPAATKQRKELAPQ